MPLNSLGRHPKGDALERISKSPNFREGAFQNPIPTEMKVNPVKVMAEYWKADGKMRQPASRQEALALTSAMDMPSETLKVRWLGHASAMLELNGLRILTDPVLSERVSPLPFAGPKRFHDSPLQYDDLPHIDLVVISHNHYDHLDHKLVEALLDTDVKFILPLGVGEYLKSWGMDASRIYEMDWHDTYQTDGITITATPARHFTNRGVLDRNKSLWASFVIQNDTKKVFFCGDSGFFPGFKDIGDQYGPFDITMIGIGAYNEQWAAIHTNPQEAVEAHRLLRGRYLLPIHWCTFDLALHSWSEPIEWTICEAEKHGVDLIIPKVGEVFDASGSYVNGEWWKL